MGLVRPGKLMPNETVPHNRCVEQLHRLKFEDCTFYKNPFSILLLTFIFILEHSQTSQKFCIVPPSYLKSLASLSSHFLERMNKRMASQSCMEVTGETPENPNAPGETSKRARTARDVGPSVGGNSDPTVRQPRAPAAEDFDRFAVRALAQELPRSVTGLREAAILSTHASNMIFQAAEEEAQRRFEMERDAEVARARVIQLRLCQTQLNEEKHQRFILSRRVRSLSLMAPAMKKCQQECRDAKMAQLALMKELELLRAELAQSKAENAGLRMAEIARETALENANAAREVPQA